MDRKITANFEAIDLKGLDQVSLMERTDKKFLVNIKEIREILKEISKDYYILEINNERMLEYSTYYYDTEDDRLYVNHHNGKLNRYKVRKRTYVETQTSFLEVKFKTNKGKTVKVRTHTSGDVQVLNDSDKSFLREHFPINPDLLESKTYNGFKRITLTDKNLTERCTIDFCFRFESNGAKARHDGFAIIELKQNRNSKSSKLNDCLFKRRIKETGFSKYCMGRSLIEADLKRNAFKPKMRLLNKIIQN